MSIASRNFFIVFDRKRTAKTDFQFNINFFYLKKFKEINFTFSYISEPFFRGTVFFGLDFKNKVRPLSFNKIDKDGILSPVNPRLFKQFLISKYNKFIAFSNQTSLNDFSTVKEMLTSFQFDKNKIIRLTFCQSCLDSQKFTIMNNNLQIKSFQNQILCSECAYDIILREAKMRGLLTHGRINPKLKNFFIHLY